MTPDLSKQRGEFEAWARDDMGWSVEMYDRGFYTGLRRDTYKDSRTDDAFPVWQAASQAAGKRERELRDALSDQTKWLQYYLTQLIHISVPGVAGVGENGFAAAQIPDWAIKQKIDNLLAALGKGDGG